MPSARELPGTETLDAQASFNRCAARQKHSRENPLVHWHKSANRPRLIILRSGWPASERHGDTRYRQTSIYGLVRVFLNNTEMAKPPATTRTCNGIDGFGTVIVPLQPLLKDEIRLAPQAMSYLNWL